MKRRRLIALVSVCSLLGLGLLALIAGEIVMRTDVARRFIENRLASAINGKVVVGRISGNPFSGVTIDTLAIRDRTGELFLSTGRVAVDYDVRDLMDTRLFLRHVIAEHPYVHLRQYSNGDWNFRRIFKVTNTGRKPARSPERTWGDYVVFDSVRALSGTFILSLSWSPDDSLRGRVRDSVIRHELARTDRDIQKTADGYARTYTWTHGNALLPHVRLFDADSNKFGQAFQIAALDADESDPPFRFRNIRGNVRRLGDSVWLALSHWDLPASTGAATGKVVWGGPLPIRYDIAVRGDSVALKDVNWVYPNLPKTGGGKLLLYISNKRDVHVMDYKLAKMDMRSTGSHLTGDMTFGVGAPVLQIRDVNLIASPIDFDFIRTMNGQPFPIDWRGQIYGSVQATGGPLTDFEVDAAHGEWRDTHVPGAVSRFSGSGGLDILNPLYTAFHDFRLNVGLLDLRSIEYLFPAFPKLGGTIAGKATLDSIWTDVRFRDADITHRDGPGKPSRLLGYGRITDGIRYITYDVSLVADSLSFETLARSYPALTLRGMAAGPITVRGQTPDLEIKTELSGPAGQLAYSGRVDLDSVGGYGAHGEGRFANVNLVKLLTSPTAPLSSLAGTYRLDISGESARTLSGAASLKLDRSKIDSVVLDSSRATVRFANGKMAISDTARISTPMGQFKAYGALGLLGKAGTDSVTLLLDSVWVSALRPYLASKTTKPDSLSGMIRVSGVARGSLDSLLINGQIAGQDLYIRGIGADTLWGSFSLFDALRAPHGVIATTATGLVAGGLAFDTVVSRIDVLDSVRGSYSVVAKGTTTPNMALAASGGWLAAGGATALRLDTLDLSMADARWALHQPVTVSFDSTMFRIDSLDFRNGRGGSIGVAGIVPSHGPVDLRVSATRVPLMDIDRVLTPSPAPLAGFGDFSIGVGGVQDNLKIDATALLDSIEISDVRIGRLMSNAHYQGQLASVGLTITQNGKQVLAASADSLPLAIRLLSYDTLPGRVHATVSADSADFTLVQAWIQGVSNVKGKMSGLMALDGSWSKPEITGQFALRGANMGIDTLGITLTGMSGAASYANDTLRISEVQARSGDEKNSFARLTGQVAFQKWSPSWFDLNLEMNDFEAYNRPELARVIATTEKDSGAVRLFGTMRADSLKGYIAVKKGDIFLPDPKLASKNIKEQLATASSSGLVVDDRHGRDTTFLDRITQNLETDLRVHLGSDLGSDVSLTADYADIPLTGDLRIVPVQVFSATAGRGAGAFISRLAPEGVIFADRGTYTVAADIPLLRRDMRVDKGGTITFDRNADWNPYLNLTTRYNVKSAGHPDIPVIVDVKGRLLPNPQLSFRTDAPFPISESDLVSYLFTGQPGFNLAGQSAEYRSLALSVLAPFVSSLTSNALRGAWGGRVGLRLDAPAPDIANPNASALSQVFFGTRLSTEVQLSDKMFVSLSGSACGFNGRYTSQSGNNSVLTQVADPLGGNFEYRLSSALRTGSNVQFAVEPSTQALLCSPSGDLNLRGVAPTPRQYSLSFLKYWRW